MRHLNDYLMIAQYKRDGIPLEKLPPDVNPNEDHLVAAGWNIDCALHHEEIHPELNDLVPQVHEEEKNKQSTASVVDAKAVAEEEQLLETGANLLGRLFSARVK
jgi:hypothetical protein